MLLQYEIILFVSTSHTFKLISTLKPMVYDREYLYVVLFESIFNLLEVYTGSEVQRRDKHKALCVSILVLCFGEKCV